MKIEVFADIVCPWCYIGERHLQEAIAAYSGTDPVEIVIRPFQLDPNASRTPRPLQQYLTQRYGAIATAMQDRVTQAAAGTGVELNWERAIAVNTREAHRVLLLAREQYPNTTLALLEALFAAHFTHGLDVSDHSVLVSLATDAGIPADHARSYLESGEGNEQLDKELAEAHEIGVQSVPTFILNDKYLIQGAQPVPVFLQVFREAA